MASKQNPAAGQTADGASRNIQVGRLNFPDTNPIPGNFQRLGDVTARYVARLERERVDESKDPSSTPELVE